MLRFLFLNRVKVDCKAGGGGMVGEYFNEGFCKFDARSVRQPRSGVAEGSMKGALESCEV